MATPSLADLRKIYFGGGSAAEYAALLAASAAGVSFNSLYKLGYTGSGSPEGVVSAPVGSLYTDPTTGTRYTKLTGSGNTGWSLFGVAPTVKNPTRPTAALVETVARDLCSDNATMMPEATIFLTSIELEAGMIINNISYLAGGTAAANSLHLWFCLYSKTGTLLKTTVDDTAASPMPANTLKTLALSGGAYTVPTTDKYYLGICNDSTAITGVLPSLYGKISNTFINTLPLIRSGTSSAVGLTTPATAPANGVTIPTPHQHIPYAYVS